MAVKIPQYEDRLTPSGFGVVPHASGVQFSDAVGQGMQNFGAAAQKAVGIQAHLLKQQQYELEQNNWSKQYAQAVIYWDDWQTKQAESQPAGAPSFEKNTNKSFDDWASNELSAVADADPRVKLQATEQMERLRVQVATNARNFELKSRNDKAVNDAADTEMSWNQVVAKDPAKFSEAKTALMTQYANSPLDPNLKHDLSVKALANLSVTAFKSAIDNPQKAAGAMAEIKSMLGQVEVTPEQAAVLRANGYDHPSVASTDGVTTSPDQDPNKGVTTTPMFGSPLKGDMVVTSGYGQRAAPKAGASTNHQGIDYRAKAGDPVYATADGTIAMAENKGKGGNTIVVDHGSNTQTGYMHLSKFAVEPGQQVKKGDVIGYVGATGNVTGPHLHYTMMVDGKAVDPSNPGASSGQAVATSGGTKSVAQPVAGDPSLREAGQYLPANALFDLYGQAKTALNQQDALWKTQFDQRVQDAEAAVLRSGTWTGQPITQQELELRHPGQGERLYQEWGKIQQLGADKQQVTNMSPEDTQRLLEAYKPTTAEGAKASGARYDILAQAVAAVTKERNDDPAGFVMRNSKVVKQAGDAFTASQSGTPDQQRAAATNYANASLAEQRRLGILNPKLLTDQQALLLGNQFNQQGDGGNNSAQLMKQMANTWGNNWPQVFGEIYKNLPPVAQVLGSLGPSVDSATSALIIQTANMKPEELKAGLPTTVSKEVTEATQGEFAGFKQTMSWQAGGSTQFSLLYGAAEKLAYVYVGQGMSPKDAASRAYNNTIGKNYTVIDNMRIPKQFDSNAVLKGADRVYGNLDKSEYQLPAGIPRGMNPKDAQKQYADGLKTDGTWVTAGDESGLILYDRVKGSPVKFKDGKDVKFTWQQLMTNPQTGSGLAGAALSSTPDYSFMGAQ